MSQILKNLILTELQKLETNPASKAAILREQTKFAEAIATAVSRYLSTSVIIPPVTTLPAPGPGPHVHATPPSKLQAP